MNKKGMFFSIMVFTLIVLVLFNYKISYRTDISQTSAGDYSRIDSMNKFIDDVIKDLDRALYIAGYRAILGINEYTTQEGTFVNQNAIKTAIINGTINGNLINITAKDHLNDWKLAISNLSQEFRMSSQIDFLSIHAYQEDPWSVIFELKCTFRFDDDLNSSYFIFNNTNRVKISIIDFEDPTYSIYTNGTSISTIKKSDYKLSELVVGNNYSRLYNAIENQEYFEDNSSPSYLGKLYGNFSSNSNGIVNFVNVDNLDSKFIYNRSCADHIYWTSNTQSFEIQDVTDVYSWFRLNNEYIQKIGLTKK